MHLVHFDRGAQDLFELKATHLATSIEHVRTFAVGTDKPAAVDLHAALLADEAEFDRIPEDAADEFENGLVANTRAELPIVRQKIREDRVGMHGHMAEDIVKDIRLRGVFERVAPAQPCGGGKAARGQHFKKGRAGHEAADRRCIPAGARFKALRDRSQAGHPVERKAENLEAFEILARGMLLKLVHAAAR